MRCWPKTIRFQLLAALLTLETLSFLLCGAFLVREENFEARRKALQRLNYESEALARLSREALQQQRPGWVALAVAVEGKEPTVSLAKITDTSGHVLYISDGEPGEGQLDSQELAQIPHIRPGQPLTFDFAHNRLESVCAIYTGTELQGYAWVEYDHAWSREMVNFVLHRVILFSVCWILVSGVLALLMARSFSQPLRLLLRGTRALMQQTEESSRFPLIVPAHNELGDLIEAFNNMVASLAEQRAGLNDTLSLLDSMLANAPIGLAFFDRAGRFVRVNQVFATMTGAPLSHHLGRTLPEVLNLPAASQLEATVFRVFAQQNAIRNLELGGQSEEGRPWTWLVSAYPVLTSSHRARWVGVIILDATDRKRSEDALRRAEKLAVTGRLAASIAHEINNPLEAVTNLLFLLRNFCQLREPELNYVSMAEQEIRRISEITQQTLRFYRQPTLPGRVSMPELLDSVLSLYHGRFTALCIEVERKFDNETTLFCFAGEIRQVFANLIGNSVDAVKRNGRIQVRARKSRSWKNPEKTGIRFTVADTGSGMSPEILKRAFEAFFTTKEATGTGLGLWVSIEIIEKHGGILHLRSRTADSGKNSGTVFQFFLSDDEEELLKRHPLASSKA
ncbi:sensor histidine kinase [Telmatobacter bradus]|uniref:sensor histidine kinase n=1 Tax=Telmatobacter bradus TaxID=474953 RepID=UPI003B429E27